MRKLGRALFRRAEPVTVLTAEKSVRRRGVIYALGQKAQDFTAVEPLRCGRLETPLYLYLGDAGELIGAVDAALLCGGVRYRVLEARAVSDFCGGAYVRAVLEREDADDGQ